MKSPPVEVVISGEYASFNRPEFKTERVSYEVLTPSAARGILEAIFWKPQFRWRIRSIEVLKPIRFEAIQRNEINKRQTQGSAKRFLKENAAYYAEEDRAQRNALVLRDVAYRIAADVVLVAGADKNEAAYRDQFRRRVARGGCFHRPYLGTREFSAEFREPAAADHAAERVTRELGQMLFDLKYAPRGASARPVFFRAKLVESVLHVPDHLYEEVEP